MTLICKSQKTDAEVSTNRQECEKRRL